MSPNQYQGPHNLILIAQPADKYPMLSKKALKQGKIEEVEKNGLWFTDIGKNVWDAALSLDKNATIRVELARGYVNWILRIDTKCFSILLSMKEYYVPWKMENLEPFAIKIEIFNVRSMVPEFMAAFIAKYERPPYEFEKIPNIERVFKINYAVIRNNWDFYFYQKQSGMSKPMVPVPEITIDPKIEKVIGKWRNIDFMRWVPPIVIIGIIGILFIQGPLIFYFYQRDILIQGIIILYAQGFVYLILTIPFRKLIQNYRVGFHFRDYKKIRMDDVTIAIMDLLRDMNLKYELQEEFRLTRPFGEKVSLVTILEKDLKILFSETQTNPNYQQITVSIGKVEGAGEAVAHDFEERLDRRVVNHIKPGKLEK
jgi:hypothetical protein